MKKYDAAHLKQLHRQRAMNFFLSNQTFTRSDVIAETGLSAVTMMKIFDYFLEKGFLLELGEFEPSPGRKPQLYRLNPAVALSIGVECDGDTCFAALVDLNGNIFDWSERPYCGDFDAWMKKDLPQMIEALLSKAGDSQVLGVGIGIPGVVDSKNSIIEFAPMFNIEAHFSCVELIGSLSQKFGLPVLIENDVNAGVVGEHKLRNEGDIENMAYIALGRGLGAGLFVNGHLLRGCHNSAGEIGYMVWDPYFSSDRRRDGFLESRINTPILLERWPELQEKKPPAEVLAEATGYVAEYLALCIANLQTIMDLELVVLGGTWAQKFGDRLLSKVCERQKRLCVTEVDCEPSKSLHPAVIGMAQIVMQQELSRILRE